MSRSTGKALLWKRVSQFLAVLVVVQVAYIFYLRRDNLVGAQARPEVSPGHVSGGFNVTATQQSTLLAGAQCRENFPKLFFELDRAVEFWRGRDHTITSADVDLSWRHSGAFRILIHNNELRILETRNTFTDDGYRPRTLSILSQIQRALWTASAVGEQLPTIEAAVVVDDISKIPQGSTHSIWTLTSRINDSDHERHWLVPDFNFYSASLPASSYSDMQRRARIQDSAFIDKIPQAVWRGSSWSNEEVRHALLEATSNKLWANTAVVEYGADDAFLSIDEICKHAIVLHTEGRSYSSRLAFLMLCNSLLIVHDLEWRTHFSHLLVPSGPEQNYVPVHRDFSDLGEKVHRFLDHPAEAQRIVDESTRTFRDKYTSTSAETCYWRNLIMAYAGVSFTPAIYEEKAGVKDMKMRGIPFEEFVHFRHDYAP